MAWLQQSSCYVPRNDTTRAYPKKARPARTVVLCRVESSEHSRRGFSHNIPTTSQNLPKGEGR
jgi:hypothetical protein